MPTAARRENRARFTAEVVEAVVAEIGAGRVGLRISPGNTAGDMREVDEVSAYEALLTPDRATGHRLPAHADRPRRPRVRHDCARCWFGPLVLNTGREIETSFCQLEELAEWGVISAAAVGRAFLANPDLIDRLVVGAELNEPDVATFYAPGPAGYIDYPTLDGARAQVGLRCRAANTAQPSGWGRLLGFAPRGLTSTRARACWVLATPIQNEDLESSDMSEEAFIYEAIRTPRGKQRNGSLNEVKPVNLVVGLIDELRSRYPDLDENLISDVILGVVSPVGDQGGDIARTAALVAKLPETTGGFQLNRFCASGLEAVNTAAQKIRSGWDDLVIAGGVESMSRVPMGSDGGAWATDPETNYRIGFVPQGIGADLIATIEGFSREDVDAYAARSQERAAAAWSGGYFAKSVVPVRDQNGLVILDHDEHMRPGSTVESLGKLKTAFDGVGAMGGFDDVALQKYHYVEKINHVHTGGNSSGIVDGAALVLVGSESAGASQGLTPRARIVATATSGADPVIMLTGPTPATKKVLDRAGLTVDDIDLFELNEAFASVVLKFQKDLNIPDEKLNVNGGAIAMGHPLGATGAMITGTMVDELERRGARRALVTLCIGGGMGVATIIERV